MEKGRTESRSFQSFNPSLVPALGSRALSPHPQTSSLRSPPSPALYRILMQVKPKALNPLRKKNPSSALCLSLPVLFFFPPFLPLYVITPGSKPFWEQLSQRAWCLPPLPPRYLSPWAKQWGGCTSQEKAALLEIWPNSALAIDRQAGTTMSLRSLSHCQCFLRRADSGRIFLKCRGQQFYLLQLAIFRRF